MKILFFALILVGCYDKRVEITPEYIINENWNKRGEEIGANSIEIKRMSLKKDSTLSPFASLTQLDILNKLEVDSSFIYTANVKIKQHESYKNKKIFFNRDNGFYWWTNKGESKIRVLGKLEKNTWYEITRLNYYFYVVYVDSTDKLHRFVVNLANY
jgi:hypothetical protein